MTQPPVFLGTSGFSYPEWKGRFYPEGLKPQERLAHYATEFSSVEINVSFYRPVPEKTLGIWKDTVPDDFAFTMKCSKVITHYKRLRRCTRELDRQWREFSALGEKLACVLFQLPPSLRVDRELLASFLHDVRTTQKKRGVDCLIAVEFRGRRWYEPETFAILDQFEAATVLHDMPYKGGFWPIEENGETVLKSGHLLMLPEDWIADTDKHFFYLRFHGTVKKKAWQRYGPENLAPWVGIANRCLLRGKPMFVYFNNDGNGAAPEDAHIFGTLLSHEGWASPLPTSETRKIELVYSS